MRNLYIAIISSPRTVFPACSIVIVDKIAIRINIKIYSLLQHSAEDIKYRFQIFLLLLHTSHQSRLDAVP